MPSPAVSVIIPFYNAEAFLAEAVQSVLAQTLEDIEVICVNDGSTDDSLYVLKPLMRADRRIRLIDKPNGGYGNAMNCGLEAASGEYIGIVEADDFVAPAMYERLLAAARDNQLDFVRADFNRFYEVYDGRRIFDYIAISPYPHNYNRVLDPQHELQVFNIAMQNWTGIYRREFVVRHGIRFNESPGASFQDNGFWWQTYMWGRRAMCLDEAFYNCRRDNPASSVAQTDKVHQMLDEYVFIRQLLADAPEHEARLLGMFHYRKFCNCFYAFTLLAPEHQMEFISRFRLEFMAAIDGGELDRALFDDEQWGWLSGMIERPLSWLAEWRDGEKGRLAEARRVRNQLIASQLGRKVLLEQLLGEGGLRYVAGGMLEVMRG